jgi:Alpha/beta hydrolase of unknown function (DUF1400)
LYENFYSQTKATTPPSKPEMFLVYPLDIWGDFNDNWGDLVQANPNRNGARELLTGLTLAAADPQGLSLLTFLRKYPAPTLRLNLVDY